MANERITITVLNWQKWQPRSDIKRPTWFAMANDLLDHPDFVDFSPMHFHALIYIFSQASRRGKETFDIVVAHAKQRNITEKVLNETIEKLERIQCVRVEGDLAYARVRDPNADVQNPFATDRQTDITNKTDRHNKHRDRPGSDAFDFESVYEKYPRKEGKNAGMKSIRDQVGKSAEEFAKFEKAVEHYAALVKKRGTEPKFIKQWSSFVGSKRSSFPWHEYVERPPELDAPLSTGKGPPAGGFQRDTNPTDEFNAIMSEAMNDAV